MTAQEPTYYIPLGSSGEYLELQLRVLRASRFFYKDGLIQAKAYRGQLEGFSSRRYSIQTDDGHTHEVTCLPRLFDSYPAVLVDGVRVEYEPPLPLGLMRPIVGVTLAPFLVAIGGTLVILVLFGAYVVSGETTPEDFLALLQALLWFLGPLAFLGLLIIHSASMGLRRLEGARQRAAAVKFAFFGILLFAFTLAGLLVLVLMVVLGLGGGQ